MSFFSDLQTALDALRAELGDDVDAAHIPAAVTRLSDGGVVSVIERASALVKGADSLRIAASGVVAARSSRDAGHSGLAQERGHRSPVSLIQDLTGTTRAEAVRQVRLGTALAEGAGLAAPSGLSDVPAAPTATDATDAGSCAPWHSVLGRSLLAGVLTSAQHDAIFRGLGAPPVAEDGAGSNSGSAAAGESGDGAASAEAVQAWAAAAGQLTEEAGARTVEELGAAARAVRDLLDPVGASRRFDERFQGRSFRTWTDTDGIHRASICLDDEMAAWVRTIIDTALRPRRGGPRFIDPDEAARAEELVRDPRTNDQLTYDLIMDTLRAGALADAEAVFGTRQAGIRVVITAPALGETSAGRPAVGLLEDTDAAVPGWLIAQRACHTGTITCTVDDRGNPLDVGREHRLFTPKQRIALAIRDGGCRWRDCDRPASTCEAHHIDPYATGGRTDLDRGILLCRFHHMQLHHGGWHITRREREDFVLHPPGGHAPVTLPTRLPRRHAWGDLQPPPRRTQPAA